jgi:GTPase Era involved in 16S rRNA processing
MSDEADSVAIDRLEAAALELAEAVKRAADERGQTELVRRLEREMEPKDDASVTVVVAGETKRGKSSLLNALLGRDLLPVAERDATSTHIVIRSGSPETARVVTAESPEGISIALSELDSWATIEKNPCNKKGVRGIELSLEHPLLARGIAFIDTPGAGGLATSQGQITKESLAIADLLLFVLESDAVVSAEELDFLADAADRVGLVLFVLTKIDQQAEWKQIRDGDRERLSVRSSRFKTSPFLQTSCEYWRKANAIAQRGDEDLAQSFRKLSGMDELEAELLTLCVGRVRLLRLGNLLRSCMTTIVALDGIERAIVSATDDDVRLEMDSAKTRLAEFTKTRRQSAPAVTDAIVGVKNALTHEADRALDDLKERYLAAVGSQKVELEELPVELENELIALSVRLNAILVSRLVVEWEELQGKLHLETGRVDPSAVDFDVEIGRDSVDRVGEAVPGVGVAALPGTVSMLWLGERAVGAPVFEGRNFLSLLLPGLGFLAPGAGLVAGAIFGALNLRRQGQMRDRTQASILVTNAISSKKGEIYRAIDEQLLEVRRRLEERLLTAIDDREQELLGTIAELDRVRQLIGARRQAEKEAAADRIAHLSELKSSVESIWRRAFTLQGARSASEVPA